MTSGPTRVATILDLTRRVIDAGASEHERSIPEIAELACQAGSVMPQQAPRAQTSASSLAWLEAAIRTATTPADRALASALLAADDLIWIATYADYDGGELMAPLKTGYLVTLLAGPAEFRDYHVPYVADDYLIGFTLQAPGTYYPPHAHVARELYHVIGGRGEWQLHDGAWNEQRSGGWIFHPSNALHAMRTEDEPMLTLVAWIDGLDQPGVRIEER